MYYVYKIVNKINGKMYIGKTNNPDRRFTQHIKGKRTCISKAIRKYGTHNFDFIIIDSNKDPIINSIMEYEYIREYNTISPNGYNLIHEIDRRQVMHKDSKDKLSKNSQGKRGSHTDLSRLSSKYVGVYKDMNDKYKTSIRINRKVVSRGFLTEETAAEAYDKLVLYVFGIDAKLNFPEKRQLFLEENLEEFYNQFMKTYYKCDYFYVSPNTKHKKWRVRMDVLNIPDKMKVPFMETDILAAEIADQFIIKYKLNKILNFPNKIYDIAQFDKLIEDWKVKAIPSSNEKGISYMKTIKKWRAYVYVNKKQINLGYYLTEEEAISAKNKFLGCNDGI